MGTGSLGAGAAVLGFAAGATLAVHGPLLALNLWVSGLAAGLPLSVDEALRLPRWLAVAGIAALALAAATVRPSPPRTATWRWDVTGLALAAVGALAWISGSVAGWPWGLSITGPSRSVVESAVLGMPEAAGWGTAMVVGIPLGAWLSARARRPIVWRAPERGEIVRRFSGGTLMGLGGTLAAGCNIGNALTGLSVLSLNSVIATAAIVCGVALAVAVRE